MWECDRLSGQFEWGILFGAHLQRGGRAGRIVAVGRLEDGRLEAMQLEWGGVNSAVWE